MSDDAPIVLRWHPSDPRPFLVAFAAENSISVLPWTGTDVGDRLRAWLMDRASELPPHVNQYLAEVATMYADAFNQPKRVGEFMVHVDQEAFTLFTSLCAYTHAVCANAHPI